MSVKGEAAIVGVADLDLVDGRVPGERTVLEMQALTAKAALADAGLNISDVDGLFVAGAWGLPGVGYAPTMAVAEYLGIVPAYSDSTNIGGSAPEAQLGHAAAAIKAGLCDVALILYGSDQRSARTRPALISRELQSQFEVPWGMPTPMGDYAMAANRHMHQYGTTSAQLAEVAVSARKWAQLNPKATRRDALTVEDVLASPMLCDPLHVLDCCLMTDGAGAIVVTSAARAKDSKKTPVWLLGHGEAHTHSLISSMPDLTVSPAKFSGARAFEMAGVSHRDIDVVEVYDSFTITVLMTLEALGFCAPGEAGDFMANGRTAPGGSFPLNTNGGGLSYAHPGMYGIFLIIEAVRQLRAEAGERQIDGAELALVNGTGGLLSSASTCILGVK